MSETTTENYPAEELHRLLAEFHADGKLSDKWTPADEDELLALFERLMERPEVLRSALLPLLDQAKAEALLFTKDGWRCINPVLATPGYSSPKMAAAAFAARHCSLPLQ